MDFLNPSKAKNIQELITTNTELGDFVKKQLNDDRVTQDTLNKLEGLLPNNVSFIEKNNVRAGAD